MKPKILICIPARGGSKRLPRKNLAHFGKSTLLGVALDKAKKMQEAPDLAVVELHICVSTDDDEIAASVDVPGVRVIRRPQELASDSADGIVAPVHALQTYAADGVRFDGLMLIQCTSPLASPLTCALALDEFRQAPGTYVGCMTPGVPNGAFWLTPAERLLQARNWGYANAVWCEMPEHESIDIDCEYDLEQARRYL